MHARRVLLIVLTALLAIAGWPAAPPDSDLHASPQAALQTPEQFLGFRVGSDNTLVRWDKIVDYMRVAAGASPRIRVRELGKTTNGNPFIAVEISAPETLQNLDRYKALERKLYFQGGAPTDSERDEIFRAGKAVVLVTCSIHATEIGASQMSVELVHRLATDQSAQVKKILDNVIFVLVPSLNPDGQIMVTDWFTKNLGTPYEASSIPYLYHPYIGHDNNRDMYMFTQKESQLTAKLLWHDWFPAVWLDEHQMGSNGARIFVMPATDPINPNVDPLIYRWNGIFGQSQAAALEAAGKEGIIYNSTYTNFWQGAMAWSGWWHNQVGLLTEVASARIAAPLEQRKAQPGVAPPPEAAPAGRGGGGFQQQNPGEPLPPPRDVMSRTEYPRPWLGGRWTLRDIVDYELIATMGLLDAAADRREALLRHIYEVNKRTVEAGQVGDVASILIPIDAQHDPREAIHLVERLRMGGVEVSRAGADFEADGKTYPAGTFVVPMTQVFARYAKDLLEKQTYPEVRRTPTSPPEPPYDVTAWSLGMQLGVKTVFLKKPVADTAKLAAVTGEVRLPAGTIAGTGPRFVFDYRGADTAIAINRLLKDGADVAFEASGDGTTRVAVSGVPRPRMESVATEFSLNVKAGAAVRGASGMRVRAPRIGMYQPWGGGNMDEGWTRWVLEQYEFTSTVLHNADVKAGTLRDRFDAILLADQSPRAILNGASGAWVRPEYRGGIGDEGVEALKTFVAGGGTLVTLGAASGLAIERWPIAVRDLKAKYSRDEHFAPGSILRLQVDPAQPLGFGMPAETYGFYINSPFFELVEGFSSESTTVVARYPNADIVASGWLKGEELMAGRAAVVSIDVKPGRIVLFGLRPQHRAQTHATFPLLFNALYLSATGGARVGSRE
jgi:hypothetical protein